MLQNKHVENYNSSDLNSIKRYFKSVTSKNHGNKDKYINHSLYTSEAIGPKIIHDLS